MNRPVRFDQRFASAPDTALRHGKPRPHLPLKPMEPINVEMWFLPKRGGLANQNYLVMRAKCKPFVSCAALLTGPKFPRLQVDYRVLDCISINNGTILIGTEGMHDSR
jgi:hypothetical protein